MSGCTSADGVLVASVRPGTDAASAGLLAGDRVLAVNGEALRDAIDFQFHAADDVLRLGVERDGIRRPLTIARARVDLGVELVPPRPGDIATCANKCVFCFIHQLPRGMRRSLYVKDDDYRLSFLHGNHITLTCTGAAVGVAVARRRDSQTGAKNLTGSERLVLQCSVVDCVQSRMTPRMTSDLYSLGDETLERVPAGKRKVRNPRRRAAIPSITPADAVRDHEYGRRQSGVNMRAGTSSSSRPPTTPRCRYRSKKTAEPRSTNWRRVCCR